MTEFERLAAKATKRPWRYKHTHLLSTDAWYVITDAAGFGPIVDVGGKDESGQVGEAKYLVTPPETIEANAAYLIIAANYVERLIEAVQHLQCCRICAEDSHGSCQEGLEIGALLASIEQAAKGEQ